MNNYVPYSLAKTLLDDMIHDLIEKPYPCVFDVNIDLSRDGSNVGYEHVNSLLPFNRSHPQMRCIIGGLDLVKNMTPDRYVRDVDIVWIGKHIAHEARHLYQERVLYQQEGLSDGILDMARIDALMGTFDGYWRCVYPYAPSELDADIYGFIDTVDYFDKNITDSNGKPLFDAKFCLTQRSHELGMIRALRVPSNADYDDIIRCLISHMQDYKCLSRGYNPGDVLTQSDWNAFGGNLSKCPRGLSFVNAENRTGVEYDEKLFSLLLDVNSTWVDLHKGLDKEVKRIRKLYPSELGISDRFANKSSRFINTRDENRRELESKIFAMGTDLDKKLNASTIVDYHL